jgi:hypothetical protein
VFRKVATHLPDMDVYFQVPQSPEKSRTRHRFLAWPLVASSIRVNRRLERRGRRLVRSDVGRLYLGAADVAGEIHRDTVDEAPYLITAQILTGLISGRCTSAADVVSRASHSGWA